MSGRSDPRWAAVLEAFAKDAGDGGGKFVSRGLKVKTKMYAFMHPEMRVKKSSHSSPVSGRA